MIDLPSLKAWFLSQKRSLPWRLHPTPYAVWVSEVMLQQTQVAVVVPYFERWMKRFPTIQALAEATLDEVIKEWEGLGYYSRARHLHEGARYVLENYRGNLPPDEKLLSKIKGLGPYTIGAIRSFAFHQRAAAIDGNVLRVIARYYKIEEDISKPKTVTMIRGKVEELLPQSEPWIIAEALIELGATLCQRKPKCEECPLKKSCAGYIQGVVQELPIKSIKTYSIQLYRAVTIIFYQEQLLVRRGKKGEIMADLHEFPYFEIDQSGISQKFLQNKLQKEWGLSTSIIDTLPLIKHSFTKYVVSLFPFVFRTSEKRFVEGYQWYTANDLKKLAFSSGHRAIKQMVLRK